MRGLRAHVRAHLLRALGTAHESRDRAARSLGVGSLIPAGGLGGLALGVWALRRAGMPPDQVATRSVAFFLIKCAANFVAVAVLGAAVAGLGPRSRRR